MSQQRTQSLLVNLGFLVPAVLFFASTLLSALNIRASRGHVSMLSHTYEVLLANEKLLSGVRRTEASARGYVITHRPTNYENYHKAQQALIGTLDTLRFLTRDNPRQQLRYNRVGNYIRFKKAVMDSVVALVPFKEVEELAPLVVRSGNYGKAIRKELDAAAAEESNLKNIREGNFADSYDRTNLFEIAGLCAGIIIVLFGFSVALYQRRRLRRANDDLELTNAVLERERAGLERAVQDRTSQVTALLAERNDQLQAKLRELEDARRFQTSLLPLTFPDSPWEIAARMWTAEEVGGDYYDYYYNEPEGELRIILGDAAGHGLMAAMIVSSVYSYWHAFAALEPAPILLERISKGLYNLKLRLAFMAVAVMRLRGNILELTSAGMPPLLIWRKATGQIEQHLIRSIFLGSAFSNEYQTIQIPLYSGDVLLASSDGIMEARNAEGELFGIPRMEAALAQYAAKPMSAVVDGLYAEMNRWAGGSTQKDDVSIMAIRVK